jgi:epoxyqueuosine reductase QueG
MPNVSLRYLAARSGIGWFGLSGNVIRENEGAALIFGATDTEAELIPKEPLPRKKAIATNAVSVWHPACRG